MLLVGCSYGFKINIHYFFVACSPFHYTTLVYYSLASFKGFMVYTLHRPCHVELQLNEKVSAGICNLTDTNPMSSKCTNTNTGKITAGHQPFSEQNWSFPNISKSIWPFSDYFVHQFIKWPYTFANGQTLVEVFVHFSVYFSYF